MQTLYIVIYLVCFCLIGGCAFAMMYANIQSIWNTPPTPPRPRHPEAPMPGEEVMYVKFPDDSAKEFQESKDKLENLFNK